MTSAGPLSESKRPTESVVGSPGIGRPYDAAPGPDGQVSHDGAHALLPANAQML